MENQRSNHQVWIFFILAYAITWGLSALVTYLGVPVAVKGIGSLLLHYGPALAAMLLAFVMGGNTELRKLLAGLGKWRAGIWWYIFIFFFPVVIHLLAVGMNVMLGGELPQFFSANDVPAGNPLLFIIPLFLIIFFQAGLAEEIGWRGYALPRLQVQYNALVSSLILGVVWTFWHYHPQNLQSLIELGPWYLFSILPFTILMTWVYNNTDGSVLLVALFHTASNLTDWIVPIHPGITSEASVRPFILYGILLWIAALAVLKLYGVQDLKISTKVS